MSIKAGDRIRIHYKGTHADGSGTFDSSYERGEPLEFTAGGPELIHGVSQAVIGMAVGDKKTVEVPPEEGYGTREEAMVGRVPRDQLPEGVEIDMMLQLHVPNPEQGEGQPETIPVPVRLTGFEGDEALLDGNHPLAGKALVFELEIVEIVDAA